MKAGELRNLATSYGLLLSPEWKRNGSDLLRRNGDWLQIIAFNASRFADRYAPRNCFEFLKMPGPVLGGMLGQELCHSNGAQRWVTLREPPEVVFRDMERQFRPSITSPLSTGEIEVLLQQGSEYWPHAYALCVIAAERQERQSALHYFSVFQVSTQDKPYPWVVQRTAELDLCLRLTADPPSLSMHLDQLRSAKLQQLPLFRGPDGK